MTGVKDFYYRNANPMFTLGFLVSSTPLDNFLDFYRRKKTQFLSVTMVTVICSSAFTPEWYINPYSWQNTQCNQVTCNYVPVWNKRHVKSTFFFGTLCCQSLNVTSKTEEMKRFLYMKSKWQRLRLSLSDTSGRLFYILLDQKFFLPFATNPKICWYVFIFCLLYMLR